MRKWIAGLLALLSLVHGCLALAAESPLAEGPPLAAQINAYQSFERYQSYKLRESGEWSAHDLMAAQLLRTISSGAGKAYMGTGLCMLYPRVRGNIPLGLTEVVLNVCLLKTQPLGADSLSILVGDTRYDFIAAAKKDKIGVYVCETFELPMDARGIDMLKEIARGGCSVSIYGGTKQYRTTINEKSAEQTAKQKLEAMSIGGIRNLLAEFDQLGLWNYALWDLNAGQWSVSRPQMSAVSLSGKAYSEDLPKVDEVFQCLVIADKTAVTRMQQLLKDNAFYAGKMDGKYGSDTRAAIREAQRYFGLLQTGQADQVLLARLSGVEAIVYAPDEAAPPQSVTLNQPTDGLPGIRYRCEGVAEVRLDRRWFAQKLLPTHVAQSSIATTPKPSTQPSSTTAPTPAPTSSPADKAAILPKNTSNMLLVMDGELTNLGAEIIFLPMSTQAAVTINGQYSFACTIRCEQAQGKTFGTALLPLESARLVIFTEMPEGITDNHAIALTVKITTPSGTMELAY